MKKRVLIFHPAMAPYRLDLFNSLNKYYELKLVFANRNVPYQNYDQDSLLKQLDADYAFLGHGFSLLGREIRFGVARMIAGFAPDVIVSNEYSLLSLQIATARLANNPRRVVWTADNPEIVRAEKTSRSLMRRLILPRIDGLIVYSDAIRKYYQSHFKRLPQTGISPNAQSEVRLREKLDNALPTAGKLVTEHSLAGKKVLLYVGRLAEVKRVDRLLRAFAVSMAGNEKVMLALVGGGVLQASLTDLARELGIGRQVIFAGHCEGADLLAWFGLGAVFALTSDFEPWGAVVNEALIAGLPVVCSREVGARELITEGVNGTVRNADDKNEFGAALGDWLGRANELDTTGPSSLKKSLMTTPFSEVVAGFRAVIDGPA